MSPLTRSSTRWLAACALVGLGLTLLAQSAQADAKGERERRRGQRAHVASAPQGEPDAADAIPKARRRQARIALGDLAATPDALRLSSRASESFAFTARADQVLTAAELELPLHAPEQVPDLSSLDVMLNGELIRRFLPSELAARGTQRLALDPALLASTNLLTLRLRTAHDADACGVVAPGSWLALRDAALLLTSADLPLPNDLAVLPLPFFDAAFDREQTLHFVLSAKPTSEQLAAANLVAGWFALQGKGRLSFDAHAATLPDESAIVFIGDPLTARVLGLELPTERAVAESGLELRPHPEHDDLKLLIVWGLGHAGLAPAARQLVREGTGLNGPLAAATSELQLPELAAHQVPSWVAPGDVVLGRLPERPKLRVEGGRSETLRIPFRLPADLFAWPTDHVELELGFAQNFSDKTGPANLHVALNGVSIGVLPSTRRGRSALRIERDLLRGFNELLLQISYPERAARPGHACDVDHDTTAWVELSADSRLELGTTERFAMLPDLGLFLYDGFPFSEHGDLRETSVVLPSEPHAMELASMFGAVAHLSTVTGHAPTRLAVSLGLPDPSALTTHDVLLIAASGRHPWLARYRRALPLWAERDEAAPHYPEPSQRLRRYLAGRFDDSELARAARALDVKSYAAVMAVPSPWAAQRALVVITASDVAHMPPMSQLLGYASAERPRNDLLVKTATGRSLFQLSTEQARGSLPWWLALRWWLAHYWLLLLPLLFGAALLWALYARHKLSSIADARLREADA